MAKDRPGVNMRDFKPDEARRLGNPGLEQLASAWPARHGNIIEVPTQLHHHKLTDLHLDIVSNA